VVGVLKTISIPKLYLEKIRKLKAMLGVRSDSEIIRRAIDELASKYGVEVVKEVRSGELEFGGGD